MVNKYERMFIVDSRQGNVVRFYFIYIKFVDIERKYLMGYVWKQVFIFCMQDYKFLQFFESLFS